MGLTLATDCKHYLGDRPCAHRQSCRCEHYAPMGTRILIIKLGALGDVVRTACLLPTLRRLYEPAHITWVSKPSGVRILAGHPQIDRLVAFDAEGILTLQQQAFDLVLSLDKEPAPAALCKAVNCPDKRGMVLTDCGAVEPCDAACEDYFELGLDDDLKFHSNRLSYGELIHRALSLPYQREPYRLYCSEADAERAARLASTWRTGRAGKLIGLNTGSGAVFANKAPKPVRWVEAADGLLALGYDAVLLGGPDEEADHRFIAERVGAGLHLAGCQHGETQFTAIVSQCDAVVTGDTLALHVAIARDVPVVALFGPTCHQEIDLYDRGVKLLTPLHCGPCYRRRCEVRPSCMDAIEPARIVSAVESVCPAARPLAASRANL